MSAVNTSGTFVARHYRTEEAFSFAIAEGRYVSIEPLKEKAPEAPLLAPGLVDLQINGFGGVDFNRAEGLTPERWKQACRVLLAHGCTAFLATLITHSADETDALLALLAARISETPFNCIGIHLEGPFLNPDPGTRGAHDPARMIPADEALFARWQKTAGGRIRLITLAPEIAPELSLPFIRARVAEGVRISIGHSLAMGDVLREAVAAGASCWTHLGNAMPRQVDKFDNVILHALAEENLFASLIPDGAHLPRHAFRALARALGPRLLLTTDAMAGAGMLPPAPSAEPATVTLGYQTVALDERGCAVLPGSRRLAGSTLLPFSGVFTAATLSGLPWADCWDAFSLRPAQWIGHDARVKVGNRADFALFRFDAEGGMGQYDICQQGKSFRDS
ncbi:N-acetylglucosamine-6-phosphate deacetylase [Verrucomicrobium sp. GAS474]|uniref:N-acetylglucosamine-6-phosphate deacetylase n=1 Tax=Verrucomicrobium sp. GAS474 TaxID=1882831 RepID=UPI00087A8D92|nr:amidohydrolase family protein [Verrucomicrobium sp. GAS474]SDT97750.1 N-acetylglucosamine-6-phosphate deacetylase [Verrucomicrobium sp. GAS474]